ncbi:MAG TPA: ATP-binding protein [Usitatibacter sp.]|nr:ATP-binding protein [Usitatibacter sp.]
MATTFQHTLEGRVDGIRALLDAVESWAGAIDLPPKALFRLNLVLEELATNIVRHGYRDDPAGKVDVNVVDDGAAVTLTLRDQAAEFDPFKDAPEADLDEPVHTRRIGGLGVHFVKQMAQSYSYRRDGADNEIVVRLPRAA